MSPSRQRAYLFAAITVAGLALRVLLIPLAINKTNPSDHDDFVRWGLQALDDGVTTVYDRPPAKRSIRFWSPDGWLVGQRPFDRLCNYPPLSVYTLTVSAAIFRQVRPDELINTYESRAVFASWAIVCDFVVAAGCAALVARWRRGWAPLIAYGVAVALPPFWYDSVIWGQTESTVLASLVWMLWAMTGDRWWLAGALYGVALVTKPQAILFAPVWAYAIVTTRPFWRPIGALGLSGAVVALVSAPFLLHSGLNWFRASYVENLTTAHAHETTLHAFNIWYLDLLLTDADDAAVPLLGLSRLVWGKLLLVAGLAAGFFLLWRRFGRDPRRLELWSVVCLLTFLMLPTRVHERYLVLALPFVLGLCAVARRFVPGLVLLTAVSMMQLTWPHWIGMHPAGKRLNLEWIEQDYKERAAQLRIAGREPTVTLEQRLAEFEADYARQRGRSVPLEWAALLAALGGAAWVVAGVLTLRAARESPGERDDSGFRPT